MSGFGAGWGATGTFPEWSSVKQKIQETGNKTMKSATKTLKMIMARVHDQHY